MKNRKASFMSLKWIIIMLSMVSLISSCKNGVDEADAYGNFESIDQLVTAEMPGKLIQFNIKEGQMLNKGDSVALVDTSSLHLKKLQLLASIQAIKGKFQNPAPQIALFEKQIQVLKKEEKRVSALLKADAATPKQLDDLQGKIEVLQQQILTTEDQAKLANASIMSQVAPIKAQIKQIEDQIDRCYLINPRKGSVLLKFAEEGEMVGPSRPLYKIADISSMELRAYVSGTQLPYLKIGQLVDVEIDKDEDSNQGLEGTISWISDKAEFTPKTIQTKEERVNLVYAIKVSVDNSEGMLKIGMPGEVHFRASEIENEQ